ncbi:FimV/HubP family polar landmark protein, partial [Thalassotalea castellviae]
DEIPDNAELTDPDDIDALMDSMASAPEPETASEAAESAVDEIPDNAELTDPDDIDALLASMTGDSAPEPQKSSAIEESAEDKSNDESDNDSELDTKNHEQIDNFSEEYVAPFLSADFSDLTSAEEEITNEATHQEEAISDEDDIDIDALIADVADNNHQDELSSLDIGDDLGDTISDEVTTDESADVNAPIDDEILNDISSDFDESTLTELLNDEDDEQTSSQVELSPDFTDSNVLADLLADDNQEEETEQIVEKTEATEINDIQELDSLDFDELLANIEEEAPTSSDEDFDLSDDFEIADSIESLDDDTTEQTSEQVEKRQDDFISVDSLISDTLSDSTEKEEPYDQTNIDVGLGDFPEFTSDINQIDVDEEDDNGVAAKLDLAKVYIEIGDNENAEVILQDVVKIGDAEQQFEAQQLLDSMN